VTETDAPRKLLEPRFGAEGIEARSQEDARIESFLIAFFEANHRLILYRRELRRSRQSSGHANNRSSNAFQVSQQPFRLTPFAGCGVGACKISQACRAARGKLHRFLQFYDCFPVHLFLEVCLLQLIVGKSKIRIHLDRPAALEY